MKKIIEIEINSDDISHIPAEVIAAGDRGIAQARAALGLAPVAHRGVVITTPDFWDCECKEEVRGDFRYIHPVSQDYCEECCNLLRDMPESRSIEVLLAADIPGHPCFGYTECEHCADLCASAIPSVPTDSEHTRTIAAIADTRTIAAIADTRTIAAIADTRTIAAIADTRTIAAIADTAPRRNELNEETEPFNVYFAPDTAFAALRRILAELDRDLVEYPSMEGLFPICIFPDPYDTGFAIEQINQHGEPDGFGYTGAYIKINKDGSVALVSAGGDEDVAT